MCRPHHLYKGPWFQEFETHTIRCTKRTVKFVHPGMASEPLEPPEFHDFRNTPPSAVGSTSRTITPKEINKDLGTDWFFLVPRTRQPERFIVTIGWAELSITNTATPRSRPRTGNSLSAGAIRLSLACLRFSISITQIHRKWRNRELGSGVCQQFSRNSTASPESWRWRHALRYLGHTPASQCQYPSGTHLSVRGWQDQKQKPDTDLIQP